MLPQTTLEMKAPSRLCAVHTPGYNLAMLYSISHVHVNGLQLLTFQKEGIIQYVPFLFYTGTLHPILVQTLSLICNKSDQNYTNSLTSPSMSSRYDLI